MSKELTQASEIRGTLCALLRKVYVLLTNDCSHSVYLLDSRHQNDDLTFIQHTLGYTETQFLEQVLF